MTQDANSGFLLAVGLPPAVADKSENGQGRKGQVNDSGIQCLGRSFTQLLGAAGADGALGPGGLE